MNGNINYYLNELAKEIKKRRGRKFHIEVLIVGGAALMLGEHEFRDGTVDIDAYVQEMASLKDCVFSVADKHDLPSDWFNTDFLALFACNTAVVNLQFLRETGKSLLYPCMGMVE